jgi:hypothetical protein
MARAKKDRRLRVDRSSPELAALRERFERFEEFVWGHIRILESSIAVSRAGAQSAIDCVDGDLQNLRRALGAGPSLRRQAEQMVALARLERAAGGALDTEPVAGTENSRNSSRKITH